MQKAFWKRFAGTAMAVAMMSGSALGMFACGEETSDLSGTIDSVLASVTATDSANSATSSDTTSGTTSETTSGTTSNTTSDTTSGTTSNTTSDTTSGTTSGTTSNTTSGTTSNTTSDTTSGTTSGTTSSSGGGNNSAVTGNTALAKELYSSVKKANIAEAALTYSEKYGKDMTAAGAYNFKLDENGLSGDLYGYWTTGGKTTWNDVTLWRNDVVYMTNEDITATGIADVQSQIKSGKLTLYKYNSSMQVAPSMLQVAPATTILTLLTNLPEFFGGVATETETGYALTYDLEDTYVNLLAKAKLLATVYDLYKDTLTVGELWNSEVVQTTLNELFDGIYAQDVIDLILMASGMQEAEFYSIMPKATEGQLLMTYLNGCLDVEITLSDEDKTTFKIKDFNLSDIINGKLSDILGESTMTEFVENIAEMYSLSDIMGLITEAKDFVINTAEVKMSFDSDKNLVGMSLALDTEYKAKQYEYYDTEAGEPVYSWADTALQVGVSIDFTEGAAKLLDLTGLTCITGYTYGEGETTATKDLEFYAEMILGEDEEKGTNYVSYNGLVEVPIDIKLSVAKGENGDFYVMAEYGYDGGYFMSMSVGLTSSLGYKNPLPFGGSKYSSDMASMITMSKATVDGKTYSDLQSTDYYYVTYTYDTDNGKLVASVRSSEHGTVLLTLEVALTVLTETIA